MRSCDVSKIEIGAQEGARGVAWRCWACCTVRQQGSRPKFKTQPSVSTVVPFYVLNFQLQKYFSPSQVKTGCGSSPSSAHTSSTHSTHSEVMSTGWSAARSLVCDKWTLRRRKQGLTLDIGSLLITPLSPPEYATQERGECIRTTRTGIFHQAWIFCAPPRFHRMVRASIYCRRHESSSCYRMPTSSTSTRPTLYFRLYS